MQTALIKPFTEMEIKEALFSFEDNKASGSDGYTMEFYKKLWNTLKDKIMEVLQDFYQNEVINKVVNENYIALITKKDKCIKAFNYRPISLTTSLYKIVAKTLSIRLKEILPNTITENQMIFVKWRQIIDAILMANEAIDFWRCKKTNGFFLLR